MVDVRLWHVEVRHAAYTMARGTPDAMEPPDRCCAMNKWPSLSNKTNTKHMPHREFAELTNWLPKTGRARHDGPAGAGESAEWGMYTDGSSVISARMTASESA